MLAYLAQLFLNGLITGAILALTGVGASLVFGIQRVANFHGEYLTFAAYVALVLNVGLGQNIAVAMLGRDGGDRAPGGRRFTSRCCGRCPGRGLVATVARSPSGSA